MTGRPTPVAVPEGVDLELVARLRVAVARLNRQLRQQAGDLTPTMQSALVTIERHGPITLGALAAIEQVAPATVTKLVTKLVDAGLVHRTVDPQDRRIARVELSLVGAERLAESRNRRNAYLATRLRAEGSPDHDALRTAAEVLEALAEPRELRPDDPGRPEGAP